MCNLWHVKTSLIESKSASKDDKSYVAQGAEDEGNPKIGDEIGTAHCCAETDWVGGIRALNDDLVDAVGHGLKKREKKRG